VSVLLGKGDGTFQPKLDHAVTGTPYSVVAGDFNGDGNLDLATENYQSAATVLLGRAGGPYCAGHDYAFPGGAYGTPAGDVADESGDTISVLRGVGDGTFRPKLDYAAGQYPTGVAIGDFYGTGHKTLAASSSGNDVASVLIDPCLP